MYQKHQADLILYKMRVVLVTSSLRFRASEGSSLGKVLNSTFTYI